MAWPWSSTALASRAARNLASFGPAFIKSPPHYRHANELLHVACAELRPGVLDVGLDGPGRDSEVAGDLLGPEPGDDRRDDLVLAGTKGHAARSVRMRRTHSADKDMKA